MILLTGVILIRSMDIPRGENGQVGFEQNSAGQMQSGWFRGTVGISAMEQVELWLEQIFSQSII